jgi:hypothetical protein
MSSSGHKATKPSSSRSMIAVKRCAAVMVRVYTCSLATPPLSRDLVDYEASLGTSFLTRLAFCGTVWPVRTLMFRRLAGGNGGVHRIWRQIDLAGPRDRPAINGQLFSPQLYVSGRPVLKSNEQAIARLSLHLNHVPVHEASPRLTPGARSLPGLPLLPQSRFMLLSPMPGGPRRLTHPWYGQYPLSGYPQSTAYRDGFDLAISQNAM